jgi:hypothetical protein
MADLRGLEKRLNTDASFREAFLRDPVGELQRAGLVLSVDNANLLRQRVAKLRNKDAAVAGSAVRSVGRPIATTVTDTFLGNTAAKPGSRPIRLVLLDEL